MEWPEIVGRGREIEVDVLGIGAWVARRLGLGPRIRIELT